MIRLIGTLDPPPHCMVFTNAADSASMLPRAGGPDARVIGFNASVAYDDPWTGQPVVFDGHPNVSANSYWPGAAWSFSKAAPGGRIYQSDIWGGTSVSSSAATPHGYYSPNARDITQLSGPVLTGGLGNFRLSEEEAESASSPINFVGFVEDSYGPDDDDVAQADFENAWNNPSLSFGVSGIFGKGQQFFFLNGYSMGGHTAVPTVTGISEFTLRIFRTRFDQYPSAARVSISGISANMDVAMRGHIFAVRQDQLQFSEIVDFGYLGAYVEDAEGNKIRVKQKSLRFNFQRTFSTAISTDVVVGTSQSITPTVNYVEVADFNSILNGSVIEIPVSISRPPALKIVGGDTATNFIPPPDGIGPGDGYLEYLGGGILPIGTMYATYFYYGDSGLERTAPPYVFGVAGESVFSVAASGASVPAPAAVPGTLRIQRAF